jgi:hypothetical protein
LALILAGTFLLMVCFSSEASAAGNTEEVRGVADLRGRVGEAVALLGRVSNMPWQHMIRADMGGKVPEYFDLEDRSQIVVYAAGGLRCGGPILLRGAVLLTEGSSKRPGSKEVGSEIQLDVAAWRCLDRAGIEALITALAGEKDSGAGAPGPAEDLVAAGKTAIEALVAHLGDARICRKDRTLLNEGELMNRPHNAPPVEEEWAVQDVTVGRRCEELLYTIVTPREDPPVPPTQFKPLSPGSRPFVVEDWGAWWERNRAKSLAEIRAGLKPAMDAYWKSRGVQQVVR